MQLAIDFNRELRDGRSLLECQSPATNSIGAESTRRQRRKARGLERRSNDITWFSACRPTRSLVGELRDDSDVL